ncbi:MAG TPA: DinB family protein [Bryobacteraceae bacterium]|nr:DinB family protein [Bryobacteraceae bacterium]
MTISEMILPEFDQEMANTRKLLACVPDDKLSWKPHPKSMALGRLASHVAELPHWAVETIGRERLELTPGMTAFNAASAAEILEAFDRNVAAARQAIAGASDADLGVPWSLVFGGQTIFTMPRATVLRSVVMNHLIHHRAQLGVYLRLNEIAIPGMYGPSADENNMFGSANA